MQLAHGGRCDVLGWVEPVERPLGAGHRRDAARFEEPVDVTGITQTTSGAKRHGQQQLRTGDKDDAAAADVHARNQRLAYRPQALIAYTHGSAAA